MKNVLASLVFIVSVTLLPSCDFFKKNDGHVTASEDHTTDSVQVTVPAGTPDSTVVAEDTLAK